MIVRRHALGLFTAVFLLACQTRSTNLAHSPVDAAASRARAPDDASSRAASTSSDPIANTLGSANAPGAPEDYDESPDGIGDEPDDSDGASDAAATDGVAVASTASTRQAPHPLDRFSQAELERLLKETPDALGSVSLGRPNAGSLFNGVSMPENEAWKLVSPTCAYGTAETVSALSHALSEVFHRFPNTPPVSIGHLSARQGGALSPHRSHQSGRDADISFYYRGVPNRWYARATADNLDLERTLYLLRVLVEETDIEMVLIDQSLHAPLRKFALEQGLDAPLVERLFSATQGRPPIVRHAPGHATHLHLRFSNPLARSSGERLASLLERHQLVRVPPKTVTHVARSGDTLAKLATRYGTSMRDIRTHNGMRDTVLVAGRTYQIPVSRQTPNTGRMTSRSSTTTTRSRK